MDLTVRREALIAARSDLAAAVQEFRARRSDPEAAKASFAAYLASRPDGPWSVLWVRESQSFRKQLTSGSIYWRGKAESQSSRVGSPRRFYAHAGDSAWRLSDGPKKQVGLREDR